MTMPMNQEITLYQTSSKVNLNHLPRKAIIETLISYSKSLQLVNTSIGKILVVNN
jgi:hypothetical protein